VIPGDGLTLPPGVIAVLEGKFGQLGLPILCQGGTGEFQFAKEHGQRPTITDDVVHDDEEKMFLRGKSNKQRADQWTLSEIEGLLGGFLEFLLSLGFAISFWKLGQIDQRKFQLKFGIDDLNGSAFSGGESTSQDFMPLDNLLESCLEVVGIENATQT